MKSKNIADEIANASLKDTLIVEVTLKQTYVFPGGYVSQFNSRHELVEDWFRKYPLSRYHAARDGSKVGGSETITRVRTIMGKKK